MPAAAAVSQPASSKLTGGLGDGPSLPQHCVLHFSRWCQVADSDNALLLRCILHRSTAQPDLISLRYPAAAY